MNYATRDGLQFVIQNKLIGENNACCQKELLTGADIIYDNQCFAAGTGAAICMYD